MLTKDDLNAIEELLDRKLEQKLEQKLDEKFKKELRPIKKDIRKMKKDISTIIDFFDRRTIGLEKRMDRVEHHLNLGPLPTTY